MRIALRRSIGFATLMASSGRLAASRSLSTKSAAKSSSPGTNVAAGSAVFGMLGMLVLGRGAQADTAQESAVVDVVVIEENAAQACPENAAENEQDERISAVEERLAALEREFAMHMAAAKNEAFVFIKPHAVTDAVKGAVAAGLEKAGIKVKKEGSIEHSVIDEQRLIDNHYGAIASKAVALKPAEQNVSEKGKEEFEKLFGEKWDDAVKAGKVYNAADACEKLGVSGGDLDTKWGTLNRGKDLLKFGGGHYVGKVDDIYVINGFYMAMRDKYAKAPAKIHYYVVEWDPAQLSWEDFRGKVLGSTDPTTAADGSLRRHIFENWQTLGLSAQPDVGDNGVHASASPFEAMAERINWVGHTLETDNFGRALLSFGIPKETIKTWMQDAQVVVEGKKTSVFDFLEDQNSKDNLENIVKIYSE